MKLSFSTLGCPAWSYQDILRRAAEYGFDGITIRGLNGELDLVKVAEFQPTRRAETRRQADRDGLAINLVGTSTKLMVPDAAGCQPTKEHIDLGADLHCPFVRVFGGVIPVRLVPRRRDSAGGGATARARRPCSLI
jgi:sugar phosphate isomerase/epimerase